MKTLVITGAARQKGHTNQMVKLFLDTLGGDYDIIDAYRVENVLLAQKGMQYQRRNAGDLR